MRRTVLWISGVLFLIFIAGLGIAVDHVLPYSILRPYRSRLAQKLTPQSFGLNAEKLDFIPDAGIELKGWFIHAKAGLPIGTVILLHGIASCKEDMYGFAQYLTENGFNVVVYDARAHGESGGTYCTYGFIEQRDVSRAIDEVLKRYQNKGKFAVFGSSYGGAVALQAMAHESRITCGVVESTFATLHEAVQDYATEMFGFFPEFLTSRVLKNAGQIARFSPELVRPELVAREIHQPVRLVHGTDDKKISIKYGERIYRNLGSSHKEWVPVPGGDHLNLWKVDQGRYQKGSLEFLKKWIDE